MIAYRCNCAAMNSPCQSHLGTTSSRGLELESLMFSSIEVDKPYLTNGGPIQEGVEYNFRFGQHELLMALSNLTEQKILAIRKGTAEFALFVQGDVLLFLYRFGNAVPWSDAPYCWHLVPSDQRTLPPEATACEGELLRIILVEATTGIVKGLRVIGLSPDFTQALHRAIATQAARPFPWDYDEQLQAIYQQGYFTLNTFLRVSSP